MTPLGDPASLATQLRAVNVASALRRASDTGITAHDIAAAIHREALPTGARETGALLRAVASELAAMVGA